MTPNKKPLSVADIVLVGLFAAITLLGIQFFRIPLPAAVGAPFIHFGNSLAVLSILLLGGKKGGAAGAIGLGLFDLLNGYASTAPVTVLMILIVAAVLSGVFYLLKQNDTLTNIFILAVVSGLTKIVLEFIYGAVRPLLAGSAFGPAVIASFTSLPATAINAVSTVIIVTVLYFPLKKGLDVFKSNEGVRKA